MKVQEFIEKYNEFRNEELRDKFLRGHIKNVYIPFDTKFKACRHIAQMSTREVIGANTKYEKVIFKENSNTRYLLYAIQIIKWYTDIEISEDIKTYIMEFQQLEEYGLIEIIILLVSEITAKTYKMNDETIVVTTEIDRIQRMLDGCMSDEEVNENNLINFLDEKFDAVGMTFNTLTDSVLKILSSQLEAKLGEEDVEKIRQALSSPTIETEENTEK